MQGLKDLIKDAAKDVGESGNNARFSPRTTSLTVQRYHKDNGEERFFSLLEREVRIVIAWGGAQEASQMAWGRAQGPSQMRADGAGLRDDVRCGQMGQGTGIISNAGRWCRVQESWQMRADGAQGAQRVRVGQGSGIVSDGVVQGARIISDGGRGIQTTTAKPL